MDTNVLQHQNHLAANPACLVKYDLLQCPIKSHLDFDYQGPKITSLLLSYPDENLVQIILCSEIRWQNFEKREDEPLANHIKCTSIR